MQCERPIVCDVADMQKGVYGAAMAIERRVLSVIGDSATQ
jgi:hypothetical protein